MAQFCTQCGSPVAEGMAFCGNCGAQQAPFPRAPVAQPGAAPAGPIEPSPVPPLATASPAVVPKSGNVFLKIAAIVLGLFVLVMAAAIGSCVYIVYRVKRKVVTAAQNVKKEATKGLSGREGTRNYPLLPCPAVDPAQSADFRRAAAAASIPLKPGLTLVDMWTNKSLGREIEILTNVQSVDDNTLAIRAARAEANSQTSSRTLCIADLMNARRYETAFGTPEPNVIAGTTMFSMSRNVFEVWKAARPSELTYFEGNGVYGDFYATRSNETGQLVRVEPEDVPYSAIVNGVPQNLPTIHVKGQLRDDATEAYVLDDPANPITLSWEMKRTNFHVRYMKIDFPVEKKIEHETAQNGCAAVYGIYFDFDSAKPKPESDPALKEVADALNHNPNWRVKIEGHTDNVGGEAYNQTLSTHRAEAVTNALASQYSVASDRMRSAGFGASRPKATNDTSEGRALNRRVEVCRQ
jgi:hypothetical protein